MSGKYIPSGKLQGDDRDIPDRGCTTGLQGGNHGITFECDNTYSEGKITGATKSDKGDCFCDRTLNPLPQNVNSDGDQYTGRLGSARG